MKVEHFKERLLARRRELVEAIARAEDEARITGEVDVRDTGDRSVEYQATDKALSTATEDSETLEQVEDALVRIQNGTYGKCVTCGKPIEPARLEAIPWTPYCLDDQEKIEKRRGPADTPTL